MARTPLELQSLRAPFVVLSALIALSTGWAVYDEVFSRRPWKDYQREFYKLEEARYSRDMAEAEKAIDKEKLAAAQKDLAEATSAISDPAQSQAYNKAQKDLAEARLRQFDAKQDLGFTKAFQDEAYYFFREAKHHGSKEELAQREKRMAELEAEAKVKQARLDKMVAEEEAAQKTVNAFEERKAAAAAQITKLRAPVVDAERKLAGVTGKWPMLEQYWVPDMGIVDRCQNCHMAIDKSGYSTPAEVAAARGYGMDDETVKKRFGISPAKADEYVTVHDALCAAEDAAPPDAAAATECVEGHELETVRTRFRDYCGSKEAIARKWVARDGKLCTDKDTRAAVTEALKTADYEIALVFQAHPARWELLVSSHQPEKFGCTTCHGGQGSQTKGVSHIKFAHGHDDHYWPVWQDPLLDTVKVLGQQKQGLFNQSTCYKCHREDVSIDHAPKFNEGRGMVNEVGCTGCHPIEGFLDARKKGPQLQTITAKTDPGWLVNWIQYPKAWRPRTVMPNFWPDAVDAEGKPREGSPALAQRQKESVAIAAYLTSVSENKLPIAEPPAPGDAAKGKELILEVGCRGCHAVEKGDASRPSRASKDRDYAPNLYNVGDKINYKWAYNWIKNPRGVWQHTKMPSLRLSDDEARNIAAFLVSLKTGEKYPAPEELTPEYQQLSRKELADKGKKGHEELVAEGKGLIQKYGCFGCHDIKGFEAAQKIGAELTEFGKKTPDLLDFGDYITNPKEQNWYNWTHEKLRAPRIYAYERVDAKMPQFDFTESEIEALMVFLKAQSGAKVPRQYQAGVDESRSAWNEGEKVIETYGCRNCHIIQNEGGAVRDLYEEAALAPPLLPHGSHGQGQKTQPGWLFTFLKEPGSVQVRPWLKIRMPTFQFTDAEATALVRGFSGEARAQYPYATVDVQPQTVAEEKEAKDLFATLQCMRCHVIGKPGPDRDPADLAPDFGLARSRLRPEWFEPWLMNPEAIQPGTRMPGFYPEYPKSYYEQFGGDGKKQVEALRNYIFNLQQAGKGGSKTALGPGGRKTASAK